MESQKIAAANKVRMRLTDLKDAEYNPRKKLKPEDPEYQRLARSIEQFGYCDPIIINRDGTIIGGHQRKQVLLDYGYQEADCIQVDLNKQDEKALNVALNKIAGEWDNEKLQEILSELTLDGYDMTLTGFSVSEYEDLLVDLELPAQAQEDDFDPEKEMPAVPITKRGDVWKLGRHRLMCGDSTNSEDFSILMGGELADLVITDPPYNVDYGDKVEHLKKSHVSSTTRANSDIQNDFMPDDEFDKFLLDAHLCMVEAMRPGAAIYVFHADSNGLQFRQAFRNAGLQLRQCLIWEKNTFVMGRQDYQWRHEPILYGWKDGAGHYFIDDRTQDTILYEDKPQKSEDHPTMKPIPLFGRLMKNSSKPGWAVLDPFGGSGTTLIAAEQLDRRAFLMELDERFCDVIVRRWEEYTGRKAERINAE